MTIVDRQDLKRLRHWKPTTETSQELIDTCLSLMDALEKRDCPNQDQMGCHAVRRWASDDDVEYVDCEVCGAKVGPDGTTPDGTLLDAWRREVSK